jgi:P4 family phage/plasmid primase-like protien
MNKDRHFGVGAEYAVVFFVEGEKDADRLLSLGLCVTTSPEGAGKWRDHYADRLTGIQVVAIADNDEPGERHSRGLVASFRNRGVPAAILRLDGLPPKGDVSDWLDAGGTAERLLTLAHEVLEAPRDAPPVELPPREDTEATEDGVARALIDQAERFTAEADDACQKQLLLGSDVEIARRVRDDLTDRHGQLVHAEGAFWRFTGAHWEPIPDHELRLAVHSYDGALFATPGGKDSRVKLGKGRIDSVLSECAALCAEPDFFGIRPTGINCASGFIRFDADGTARLEPHHRDHRCRHTLPGRWSPDVAGTPDTDSLLARLLEGVFRGDLDADEKVTLLAEVCGSAALGYATQLIQPRAVILLGQTAENGKSQILDLARGLLPVSAVCSVPAARMGDERHIIGLVGKLLNATDELSTAAVASDTFKSVVTGEPVQGRDVYKSRLEFHSVAQNLFATNNLPAFKGGIDRGVQRRLLVVPFNRTIPIKERIENIGRRIAGEEADQLLAWAVEGAARLIRQRNFTMPTSCKLALADWIFGADPVLAWLEECTEIWPILNGQPSLRTRAAYQQFRAWATAEGFNGDKLPAINGFVQRVQANTPGVEAKRTSGGRLFLGLVVTRV